MCRKFYANNQQNQFGWRKSLNSIIGFNYPTIRLCPNLRKTFFAEHVQWNQGVSQKMKIDHIFSRLGLSCLPKVATMAGNKKKFLLQHIEFWKTPSWERNMSEHDIIQDTQITTEICFFLFIINLWSGIEINRLILFR